MRSFAVLSLGALAHLAQGKIIDIVAGANGQLAYSVTSVTAAVGDELHVHFEGGPHQFEESTFGNPCVYMSDGISSGTVTSSGGEASRMFAVKLNDTNPHWMFCGVPGHCAAGMSMVINPP
jgi:hypothetical protein